MLDGDPSITDLEFLVSRLKPADREVFHRIYRLSVSTGHLRPPASMYPWIEQHFGSVEAVASQKIVRLTNQVTGEGTLFNELRARRPIEARQRVSIDQQVERALEQDALRRPLELTPEDTFGRVEGAHSITCANVAKYDAQHGLVVFYEPHPLRFDAVVLHDYLEVARQWLERAHQADPAAKYPYVMWNCLWRAGASLAHGHFQVALARDMHYVRVEALRQQAQQYRRQHGASYFDDLYRVHRALGCGFATDGVRVMAHLTPLRDKEVVLLARTMDGGLSRGLYRVLAAYRDQLGVNSFNMGILMSPLAPASEDWDGFPVIVRLVDRGEVGSRTSDFGGMELFAENVVASDPLKVARALSRLAVGDNGAGAP